MITNERTYQDTPPIREKLGQEECTNPPETSLRQRIMNHVYKNILRSNPV